MQYRVVHLDAGFADMLHFPVLFPTAQGIHNPELRCCDGRSLTASMYTRFILYNLPAQFRRSPRVLQEWVLHKWNAIEHDRLTYYQDVAAADELEAAGDPPEDVLNGYDLLEPTLATDEPSAATADTAQEADIPYEGGHVVQADEAPVAARGSAAAKYDQLFARHNYVSSRLTGSMHLLNFVLLP